MSEMTTPSALFSGTKTNIQMKRLGLGLVKWYITPHDSIGSCTLRKWAHHQNFFFTPA